MATYSGQTPIKGKSRGDPKKIKAWLRKQGVGRPEDSDDYVDGLYEMAPDFGINADVAVAQFIKEASRREPPHEPGHGVPWLHGLNPVGIGVTSDAQWKVYQFVTGRNAAMAHLMQLSIYVNGLDLPPGYRIEAPYEDAPNPPPRWYETIKAKPSRIKSARVLSDLDNRWAVPGVGYGAHIGQILNRFEAAGLLTGTPDTTPDPQPDPQEGNDMPTHKFIISMGHRNTDRGGAYREYDWTPGAARALRDAIKARGGQAWIIQEERGNGNFYNGGLQAAARACVDLARTKGPFDAYISMHYDSSPGFHAIYPNGANDTKAMNPLDVRLCEAMARRVAATKTVRMKTWPAHGVGVMDEKETYVGSQGYRLGEFVGTLGFRDTTARVITEASGVGDDKYLHDPKWVRNVYSEALVDALEDVFGKFKGTKPEPQPEPEPQPKPKYATPDPIEGLESFPKTLRLPNGALLVYSPYTGEAIRPTPRLRHAHPGAPHVGDIIPEGLQFAVIYTIINPDQSEYLYTPWHTRIKAEDVKIVFADVDKPNAADVIEAVRDVVDGPKG